MQQAPNQPAYPSYQPQYTPPPQPPKKRSRKRLWFLIGAIIVIIATAATVGTPLSPSSTPTTPQSAATQPSQATRAVQPTTPTQKLAPLPSANDLNQLIVQQDGNATNVNITKNADGTSTVAVDVQVNTPTQTRVEHIAYGLAQYFFGSRPDVSLVNLMFHANGYTGADDPIASCGGPAPSAWVEMDESQLWNALAGAFNANLPA